MPMHLGDIVAPVVVATLFIIATSAFKEPQRRHFNAIMIAGAGAAYLNGGLGAATGGLDEEVIRMIQARVGQLRQLAERKQTILKTIENQGKLTDALKADILVAETPKRLEDLYLPYKPKKRTLATEARERQNVALVMILEMLDCAIPDRAGTRQAGDQDNRRTLAGNFDGEGRLHGHVTSLHGVRVESRS